LENENDGVAGGDALVLRSNFGELPAVLAEQVLQDHFGLLDARRIELAFYGETYFSLLEAIENVGLRNGVDAVIADAANHRTFLYHEDHVLVTRAVR
jgi:hypothetical protein